MASSAPAPAAAAAPVAAATPRKKPWLLIGIALTAGCCLLFVYALGLPLDLYPRILR